MNPVFNRFSLPAFALFLCLLIACAKSPVDNSYPDRTSIRLPAELVVIGDFGDGSPEEYAVAAAIQNLATSADVDALVTTGDNFYSDDIEAIFNEPYDWLADSDIEFLAAWGNHDIETEERTRLVQGVLDPPGRWYSVGLGNGKLIFLDSNQVLDSSQTEWLQEQLAEAASPIVVIFHHPAYSCGFHGNTSSVVTAWVPLFERHHVDLVLNGHDHDYERFATANTTYVVTGGGGRSLRPFGDCSPDTPDSIVSDDTIHHFLHVDVSTSEIAVTANGVDGEIIDTFVLDIKTDS